MPTVSDFLENLRKVDVRSLTKAIVSDNETEIVDLNRFDQIFFEGIDSNGQFLPFYKRPTQFIYNANPPADLRGRFKRWKTPYNLFWSGKSYNGFKAYVRNDKLFISTNTRGRRLLIEHGGENIFGLTPDNARKANWDIIAPKLNEAIKNKLL